MKFHFKNKIIKKEKGIWRYANFYENFIEKKNRLNLNDGETRNVEIENINKILNINHLYFKREDENNSGSFKGRSLAYQISLAKQNNKKELVISTSGNAGIAAARYCLEAGITLYVFISPRTEKEKVLEIQKNNPVIIKTKKPIRLSNYLSAKYKIENLRPSVNNSSIEGFKSIAFEIFENLGNGIEAVFTFSTSGSSFVGIGRAYEYLLKNKEIKKMPSLYAVQSEDAFFATDKFDNITANTYKEKEQSTKGELNKNHSKAGMLGAKKTRRRKEILKFIKMTNGSEIYINEKEIVKAEYILRKNGIYTSPEGAASFAGVIKMKKERNFENAVCILSGKTRNKNKVKIENKTIYKAESVSDMDKIMKIRNVNSKIC